MGFVKYLCQWVMLCIALLISHHCSAQDESTPTAAWLMPGVSYQASPKFRILQQFGYNHYLDGYLIYPQGYFELNKHITLVGAYLFVLRKSDSGKDYKENDAIVSGIYTGNIGRVWIDDRNMFQNVFDNRYQRRHYYRNRLRIGYPFQLFNNTIKPYVFDEGFYFFNQGLWSRNRLGVGCMYNFRQLLNLDLSYMYQADAFSGNTKMIFAQLTVLLPHKKDNRK